MLKIKAKNKIRIYPIKVEDFGDHLIYYFSNIDNLGVKDVLSQIYFNLYKNNKFFRFGRNKFLSIQLSALTNNKLQIALSESVLEIEGHWYYNISQDSFMNIVMKDLSLDQLTSIYKDIKIIVTKESVRLTPSVFKPTITIKEETPALVRGNDSLE
uniref:hypothetical protein n=1 Tax=Rigidoporus microporus TaxID=219653 RepID=UPI002E79403D|nr:hypothetical protein V2420_mgp24 [Rigidoporus microporus]WPS66287.1 hypothetical protein [Rigidoporus microporus]